MSGKYNLVCLMCFSPEENVGHLFISCSVAANVWIQLSNWISKGSLISFVFVLDHLKGYLFFA